MFDSDPSKTDTAVKKGKVPLLDSRLTLAPFRMRNKTSLMLDHSMATKINDDTPMSTALTIF